MTANLTTDGTPLSGRPVLMTLGSGATAQSCTGVTDANWKCQLHDRHCEPDRWIGPHHRRFRGDSYYRPASATGIETAAAPPSGGAGSSSVTSRPEPRPPGRQVNFWGSQTWKTNQFSGVNNAPASMKGYIDNVPELCLWCDVDLEPGQQFESAIDYPGEHGCRGCQRHLAIRVDGIRQHQAPRRRFGLTGIRAQPRARRIRQHHRHSSAETPAPTVTLAGGRGKPLLLGPRRGQRKSTDADNDTPIVVARYGQLVLLPLSPFLSHASYSLQAPRTS